MSKSKNKLFLYRNRFAIGYIFLIVAFFIMLISLPSIAPNGLSADEKDSVLSASKISTNFISEGNTVNLPYLILQKICISIFGVTLISVKLPSIIFAILTAFFIILLLNRWFKSDVAVISSILIILSTAFLFLAEYGTPTIMYVFWLAFLLWLGSKIVGNKHINPFFVMLFIISLGLSIYTPHLIYVVFAIGISGLIHPHLRYSLKKLNLAQLILSFTIFALIISPLVISCFFKTEIIQDIALLRDFNLSTYVSNISSAFAPFFSFSAAYDSVYLAPLFGLANIAIIIIGVLASVGIIFTSRNTVVSLLIIFSIFIAGLNPSAAIVIIVPFAILSAAGVESIIKKWHCLFPENPYAHLIGATPIIIVIGFILMSGLTHFIYGYHYTPRVTKNFDNDILLINKYVSAGSILIISDENKDFDFYKLLERYNSITVSKEIPERADSLVVYLGSTYESKDYHLKQIITSSKKQNSDRLYIYEKTTEE